MKKPFTLLGMKLPRWPLLQSLLCHQSCRCAPRGSCWSVGKSGPGHTHIHGFPIPRCAPHLVQVPAEGQLLADEGIRRAAMRADIVLCIFHACCHHLLAASDQQTQMTRRAGAHRGAAVGG